MTELYFLDNVGSSYLFKDSPIASPDLSSVGVLQGGNSVGIVADLTSSFTILLAIFFPSVTGIIFNVLSLNN